MRLVSCDFACETLELQPCCSPDYTEHTEKAYFYHESFGESSSGRWKKIFL